MMTKKAFTKFINELNESGTGNIEGFKKEVDGKIYQLSLIDYQKWHDEVVDGEEFQTNHAVFQLVHYTEEDPIKQECNWYALKVYDRKDLDEYYAHKLIPMTKEITYHPEVVIPPHEEEHFIFI